MELITNEMYSKLPNLILGFHGRGKDTYEKVLYEHQHLKKSENEYDWLGNGIYFWENNYQRARDWARNRYGEDGMVVGAVLDLGYCLNLTDYESTGILQMGYELLKEKCQDNDLPQNKMGRSKTDLLLRNLDCAVIQTVQSIYEKRGAEQYDSVMGVFTEGKPVYPGAGIVEKTHTQICIMNPNCIKGYFAPMERNEDYKMP